MLLPRILQIPEILEPWQDSYQERQEDVHSCKILPTSRKVPKFLDRKKRTKKIFGTRNFSSKSLMKKSKIRVKKSKRIKESPRILTRFPVTTLPTAKKTRTTKVHEENLNSMEKKDFYKHRKVDQIVVGYGSQPQFAAISNLITYIEFEGSQLVEPF